MRNYGRFLRENFSLLSFGFLLTLFSSFGQTFLISLYVPEIGAAFQLSNTQLSSLYAAGTLGSAFTLPWVGRYIDTVALGRFTLGVLSGLFISLLLLSVAPHPLIVLLAFYGLRLSGQGLMSHTSVSTMARAFSIDRGKAISVATLGHPSGEAILPVLVAFAIGALGWRYTLQLSALSVVVLVAPIAFFQLRAVPRVVAHPRRSVTEGDKSAAKRAYNPLRLLRTRPFWIITPAVFLLGFLNTAVFFFQVQLGQSKGWSPEWVAGSLAAYAGASALAMLLSGPLVDRLSARRTFPFFLGPYLVGLLLLAAFRAPLIYPIALFLMGFSNGAGSTIKNALLAEVYGTEIIGAVRSFFATVMVFSTALGPVTFGLMLDLGPGFDVILLLSALCTLAVMGWSLRVPGSEVSEWSLEKEQGKDAI